MLDEYHGFSESPGRPLAVPWRPPASWGLVPHRGAPDFARLDERVLRFRGDSDGGVV
jgi:hypothetical protein